MLAVDFGPCNQSYLALTIAMAEWLLFGRSLPVLSPQILLIKYSEHDWPGRMQPGGQVECNFAPSHSLYKRQLKSVRIPSRTETPWRPSQRLLPGR